MVNIAYKNADLELWDNSFKGSDGKWTIRCYSKTVLLSNHGVKLMAKNKEGLSEIKFDTDKKTFSLL